LTNEHNLSEYPPEDVLVKSFFHRILLLFHIPSTWLAWQVCVVLLLPLGAVALTWSLTTGEVSDGLVAAAVLSLFFLSDALLLRGLPSRGVSYGPWQSQLFALAILRTLAALLFGLVPLLTDPLWGFVGLIGVQFIGSLTLVYGTVIEPFNLKMSYLTVESDYFASDSQPIRILHISDLHVERLTRREEQVLSMIAEIKPDLILITGDYLNLSYVYDEQAHAHVRQLLAQISAPYGVYAVLGSPPVDARDVVPSLFDDLPIHLLVNESVVVKLDDQRQIVLLGMDCSHHLPTDMNALAHLVSTSPNHMPSVLLYHAPDLMPQAAEHGIDLYLCGHTHGGQIRLPIVGAILTSSQLGKRYQMGHYHEGQTHMYVSRGVGLEGLSAPRVRFMAPPEIMLVTLKGSRL